MGVLNWEWRSLQAGWQLRGEIGSCKIVDWTGNIIWLNWLLWYIAKGQLLRCIPCGLGWHMVGVGVLAGGGMVWAAGWNCRKIPINMAVIFSNIAFCCCIIWARSSLMCFALCHSSTHKILVNGCLDLLLGPETELLDEFRTLEGCWLPLLLFDVSRLADTVVAFFGLDVSLTPSFDEIQGSLTIAQNRTRHRELIKNHEQS